MTAGEVLEHLRRRRLEFAADAAPERIAGGNLNLVWRVRGRPQPLIVKYAPPYVATAPATPLDPNRILLEARCLTALAPAGWLAAASAPLARPPRLLDIDAERYVLVMEDVGVHPHLGEWLTGDSPPTSSRLSAVAAALAGFIGRLHAQSRGDPALARQFDNRAVQQTRYRVQYLAMRELAARAGCVAADAIGSSAAALGERFLGDGICLTMGDLWPPSVLIAGAGVRVIDWELAHFGSPAQDLGHLAAHLWMLADRAPTAVAAQSARTFQAEFYGAYVQALGSARAALLDDATRRDAAVHLGAEILMRAVGPFARGYLYDGMPLQSPLIRHAAAVAAAHILRPEECELYSLLRP
jgi:aminoglycoside phosphotransferase (APT) family kinase protein